MLAVWRADEEIKEKDVRHSEIVCLCVCVCVCVCVHTCMCMYVRRCFVCAMCVHIYVHNMALPY